MTIKDKIKEFDNAVYNRKRGRIKMIFDMIILIMFIASIFLFAWSYSQGFSYCESYYLAHCICIEANKTRETIVKPPESDYIP